MNDWLRRLMPAAPGRLRRAGVLGLNGRNMNVLTAWNPKGLYRLTDDKLVTKELCASCGIATAETYAVVDHPVQVRRLDRRVGGRREFVVKPARGAGGRGVIIVVDRRGEDFVRVGGLTLSLGGLRDHILEILSGLYSIGGRVDRAIIEQRLCAHPALAAVGAGSTPDVRIVLYRQEPVMAMLRLPTVASAGRSNLHRGAMGVGLDLRTGSAVAAVCNGQVVDRHVDTGLPLGGLWVPAWREVLAVARKLAAAIGMGYVGVDIVPDARGAAVVLEANGRPGLTIQIANRRGLLKRLADVDARLTRRASPQPVEWA
ncbi:MAG: alpha-L-glutamate ligase-like protein [Phycisphaerae bacterium]|nr:alpha-L-glutamate ligase-like protein [Phycisphaerae bacterium]